MISIAYAGRGLLDKARRSQIEGSTDNSVAQTHVPDSELMPHKEQQEVSETSHCRQVNVSANVEPLNAEAAILGKVETMPGDLSWRTLGNPLDKNSGKSAFSGQMRPSSYFQASEIKQSKRNRCDGYGSYMQWYNDVTC